MGRGDYKSAVQKFSEAAAVLPEWHLPYLNRGIAHLSLMDLSKAEADADKGLSLIRAGSATAKQHSGIAQQIKGTVKQHQGDLTAALENFSIAVELVPDNAVFLNSRGAVFRLLERYDEALSDYSKAIEAEPGRAMFYANRASIYLTLGDHDTAIQDLDKAILLDKNFAPAFYTRASLRVKEKLYDEALADYDEAIRLEPNKSEYFHARGILHITTKNYELGIRDQSRAIGLDPKNTFALSDRAVAYGLAGNITEAIKDLRSAISIGGPSPALQFNLAYFLFKSGQYAEAAAAATEATRAAPNWREPYILRSNAYVKLGATAKARADRAHAAKLGPGGRPTNDRYVVVDLGVEVPEETKP
jgi:tetratricopeptide (TPR) repeat protein